MDENGDRTSEMDTYHTRNGLRVLLAGLVVVLIVVGFYVASRLVQPTPPADVATTPPIRCEGTLVDPQYLSIGTFGAVIEHTEGAPLGAVLRCYEYESADPAPVVRFTPIKGGAPTDEKLTIFAYEAFAYMAVGPLRGPAAGDYDVEFIIDGRVVDRTFIRVG